MISTLKSYLKKKYAIELGIPEPVLYKNRTYLDNVVFEVESKPDHFHANIGDLTKGSGEKGFFENLPSLEINIRSEDLKKVFGPNNYKEEMVRLNKNFGNLFKKLETARKTITLSQVENTINKMLDRLHPKYTWKAITGAMEYFPEIIKFYHSINQDFKNEDNILARLDMINYFLDTRRKVKNKNNPFMRESELIIQEKTGKEELKYISPEISFTILAPEYHSRETELSSIGHIEFVFKNGVRYNMYGLSKQQDLYKKMGLLESERASEFYDYVKNNYTKVIKMNSDEVLEIFKKFKLNPQIFDPNTQTWSNVPAPNKVIEKINPFKTYDVLDSNKKTVMPGSNIDPDTGEVERIESTSPKNQEYVTQEINPTLYIEPPVTYLEDIPEEIRNPKK